MFLNLPGCQFWLILCRHLWTHPSFLRYSLRQDTGTIEKKALLVLQYILRCPEIRVWRKAYDRCAAQHKCKDFRPLLTYSGTVNTKRDLFVS